MQRVEDGDEVVARAGERGRGRDVELQAVAEAGVPGLLLREVDRFLVVVEARHLRARIGLGHQPRRRAEAAADVRNPCADAELLLDAVKRGDPGGDQVGVVAGPEEPLAAGGDAQVVLVPAESCAAAEALLDVRLGLDRGHGQLERAADKRWAVLVRQRHRLLGRELVPLRRRVVRHEAAGGLGVEPLADVALGRPGLLRQVA